MPSRYPTLDAWTEDDLAQLPMAEDDYHEYKSSRATFEDLKTKLPVAASAFWNSGGGMFVVGVDSSGRADGGIPASNGREPVRDWADRMLSGVQPVGPYVVNIIPPKPANSAIVEGHVVLVVAFGESHLGPHMAPDKKYYIRAGAHSDPASHFLVDAIRARRGLSSPVLRAVTRLHPAKPDIVQLVVLALNDAPALDVSVSFNPVPKLLAEGSPGAFPLTVALIDRANPFTMDLSIWGMKSKYFGDDPVTLALGYTDMLGRRYTWQQAIDPSIAQGPMKLGSEMSERTVKALGELARAVEGLKGRML